jgi:hypothetical protein
MDVEPGLVEAATISAGIPITSTLARTYGSSAIDTTRVDREGEPAVGDYDARSRQPERKIGEKVEIRGAAEDWGS